MIDDPLSVGERVSRSGGIHEDERFGIRLGTVSAVYRSAPSGLDEAETLYAVKWDGGEEKRGYLRIGLLRVIHIPTAQTA